MMANESDNDKNNDNNDVILDVIHDNTGITSQLASLLHILTAPHCVLDTQKAIAICRQYKYLIPK